MNRTRIQCWGEPPVKLLQLTHSGRASQSRPLTAFPNPYLDPYSPVPPAVVSDRELDALAERTFQAALLARRAGFDGVDLKCCHNYLFRELLAGFTRSGAYGGSFHNRTRFLLELVDRIRTAPGLSASPPTWGPEGSSGAALMWPASAGWRWPIPGFSPAFCAGTRSTPAAAVSPATAATAVWRRAGRGDGILYV